MPQNLPKYESPPVSETVLSAQFNRLPGYTGAHAGWFWKNYLDSSWPNIKQAIPILDQIERFGDDRQMKQINTHTIQLGVAGKEAERHQISTEPGDRMLQIQNTRFTYNWIKRDSGYPSYDKLLPAFREEFDLFRKFIGDAALGELVLNQWEVTYINEIYKDGLWDTLSELSNVFPGFWKPGDFQIDTLDNNCSMEIGEQKGRIHVKLSHGLKGSREGPEIIVLQLVARGPLVDNSNDELLAGFDLGHETIVNMFTSMTSEKAHKLWKRTI